MHLDFYGIIIRSSLSQSINFNYFLFQDVLCRCSLGLMIVTFLLVGGAVNITLLILL